MTRPGAVPRGGAVSGGGPPGAVLRGDDAAAEVRTVAAARGSDARAATERAAGTGKLLPPPVYRVPH